MKNKYLKKSLALVIALCMMFAMSVQTFAAEAPRPFLASKVVKNVTVVQPAPAEEGINTQEDHEETVEAVDPVEEFKSEVLRLVNEERAKVGAAPVSSISILSTLADVRAQESAVSFSHTRPDGTRCFTVFSDYTVRYRYAGENLAFGFPTPEKVVNAWMNSPSHKSNMLNAKYTNIGVGYYLKSDGKVFCSILMYTPTAASNI